MGGGVTRVKFSRFFVLILLFIKISNLFTESKHINFSRCYARAKLDSITNIQANCYINENWVFLNVNLLKYIEEQGLEHLKCPKLVYPISMVVLPNVIYKILIFSFFGLCGGSKVQFQAIFCQFWPKMAKFEVWTSAKAQKIKISKFCK